MTSKDEFAKLRTGLTFTLPGVAPAQVVKAFLEAGDLIIPAAGAVKGINSIIGAEEAVISETSPDGLQARVRFVFRSKGGNIRSNFFSVLLTVVPAGQSGCKGTTTIESLQYVKAAFGPKRPLKRSELERFKQRFQMFVQSGIDGQVPPSPEPAGDEDGSEPAKSIGRDRADYQHVESEYPAVLGAVWAEAIKHENWGVRPTVALREACALTIRGASASDAVNRAFPTSSPASTESAAGLGSEPAKPIGHDRADYQHVESEYPAVFGAVWAEAIKHENWGVRPTVALREACALTIRGVSASDAVNRTFVAR